MSVQRRPKKGKPKKGKPKWVVRYRPAPGEPERSKSFTYDEYQEPERAAKDYDAAMRDRLRQGTWVDPALQKVTVGQIYRRWADRPVREATRREYLLTAKNLGDLDTMPLLGLTSADVGAWHRQLLNGRPWMGDADTGVAETTAREHANRLASAMRMAVNEGLIGRNPVRMPPVTRAKSVSRTQIPPREDLAAIVAALRDGGCRYPTKKKEAGVWVPVVAEADPAPVIADMVLVALGTGARISELCGLVVQDVNFMRRGIYVELQASVDGKKRVPLKTSSSERFVPFADDISFVFSRLCKGKGPLDPVFTTSKGTAFRAASAGAELRKATNALALGLPWTFHSFRHYYASKLIASGVPVNGVSKVLGHADAATTLAVYTHLWPDSDDVARTAIAGIVDSCGMDAGSGGVGDQVKRGLTGV